MRVETRCVTCGSSFLIDAEGGEGTPCPVCGEPMQSGERPAVAGKRAAGTGSVAKPAAAKTEADGDDDNVVCPRCGLHFVPKKGDVATAPSETPEQQQQTVLVVEDMEYFIEIAKDALEPRYAVRTARTLAEARTLLGSGTISLMLLDLTLAGGEQAANLLTELPFKPCPILIYTAEDESSMYGETWERLQSLGADDVVLKGMNVGESIVRKVDSLLGAPEDGNPSGA